MIRLPLRNRAGVTVAHALVDDGDAVLAAYRWHLDAHGYVQRSLPRDGGPRRAEKLHRVILGLGCDDDREGDHKNGDPLDNRRSGS